VLKAFFDIMNEKVTDKENIIYYPMQCNYICNSNFQYALNEHWGQQGIFVYCTLYRKIQNLNQNMFSF